MADLSNLTPFYQENSRSNIIGNRRNLTEKKYYKENISIIIRELSWKIIIQLKRPQQKK